MLQLPEREEIVDGLRVAIPLEQHRPHRLHVPTVAAPAIAHPTIVIPTCNDADITHDASYIHHIVLSIHLLVLVTTCQDGDRSRAP